MTDSEQVDVLRAEFIAFKALMDERDRRYGERFMAMDEKTGLALTSSEKAVAKAEIATEKRFDSVNEFRGQLKDQASTLMPRSEAETKFKAIEDKLEEGKHRTQAFGQWTFQQVLTVAGLLTGLLYFALRR